MKKGEITNNESIKPQNEINSRPTFEWISNLKKAINIQKINPIMAYLEKFDTYFKKKKRILESWDVLFKQWNDSNFYIITSWELDIFRYTVDWTRKEIWKAKSGSFIWEWIIFGRQQKDVEAVAGCTTQVFALSSEDLGKFESIAPKEAMDLYRYIIEITNKRLLDSWKELSDIYELTSKILELSKNWEKWFFNVMQYVNQVIGSDYIIFIEQHPSINGFFFYKYSTELQNTRLINKKAWEEITGNLSWVYDRTMPHIFWTWINDSIYILPLNNNERLKWYFVCGKKRWVITDNEMRVSSHIWPLLGSVIENNQNTAENKALQMSKNYFENGLSSI